MTVSIEEKTSPSHASNSIQPFPCDCHTCLKTFAQRSLFAGHLVGASQLPTQQFQKKQSFNVLFQFSRTSTAIHRGLRLSSATRRSLGMDIEILLGTYPLCLTHSNGHTHYKDIQCCSSRQPVGFIKKLTTPSPDIATSGSMWMLSGPKCPPTKTTPRCVFHVFHRDNTSMFPSFNQLPQMFSSPSLLFETIQPPLPMPCAPCTHLASFPFGPSGTEH